MTDSVKAQSKTKERKPVQTPVNVEEGCSLFEYIQACELDKKLVDIALATQKVPDHLRDDAAQDIRMAWSKETPNLQFEPGQIAAYAHKIACQTALKCKREMGQAVRLPGSAFRKKEDGSTYVNCGVLANALDWDGVQEWMDFSDQENGSASMMNKQLSNIEKTHQQEYGISHSEHVESDDDGYDHKFFSERHPLLEENFDKLSYRQRRILDKLFAGLTKEEILEEMNLKVSDLRREVKNMQHIFKTHGKSKVEID